MEYPEGICLLSCIAMRAEPDSKSEMVNQVLFGEIFLVQELQNNWARVMCDYDGYEGWISPTQFSFLTDELFWAKYDFRVQTEYLLPFDVGGTTVQTLMGSNVSRKSRSIPVSIDPTPENIIAIAKTYINSPYQWGGRSLFGIDCSGFTQIVYKICGIKLLRDAYQQATQGFTVEFIDLAQTGDLVFFENEEGQIIHVGIYMGENKIIHASGKVRIDTLDHHGIYNAEMSKYSHKMRIIKRLVI